MLVKYPIMGLSYARGLFAICGGGGSLKSGIKNTVDIYALSDTDPSGFTKEISVETGMELASGVAFSHDGLLLAVSVNAACWIYEINRKEKTMALLIKFRTDFAPLESSQSCACFVGNTTILTGGEDGVVRVWRLTHDPSAMEKNAGTSSALQSIAPEHSNGPPLSVEQPQLGAFAVHGQHMITLTREYRGHQKRIREIHVDPSHRNLVVSSSEDQSCHLWRLTEVTAIYRFSKDDALDVAYQQLGLKIPAGPRKHQFRCARFANDGRTLYTVLTPARGDSILIRWKPQTIAQTSEDQWQWVVDCAAVAGSKPVASLCVSHDDKFVSCAAVSGKIRVFRAVSLQVYKGLCAQEHSFAITGMSFAICEDPKATHCQFVSGGADKSLLRHDVPFEGGDIVSGLAALTAGIKGFLSVIVGLGLNLYMATLLLFILLFSLHARNEVLMEGPLDGLQDLMNLQFESFDALMTVAAIAVSVFTTWLIGSQSRVTTSIFWNGLLSLFSGLLVFSVAISSEMDLKWHTGDSALDELLDFKISILLGALSIVFLCCHSLVVILSQ